MPKKDFAQELKENFAQGNLKPSQLKKSKSVKNISLVPPIPPLQKSKSAEELSPVQPSLAEQVKTLKQELAFSQNTAQNYLERLQQLTAEFDQKEQKLKDTQQANTQLTDQNNELRLNALKSADQITAYEKEINQAAQHYSQAQQNQVNYVVQNKMLLKEKADLTKQLQTAQRRIQQLYQLKGLPYQAKQEINWTKWLLIGLVVYGTITWLLPERRHYD